MLKSWLLSLAGHVLLLGMILAVPPSQLRGLYQPFGERRFVRIEPVVLPAALGPAIARRPPRWLSRATGPSRLPGRPLEAAFSKPRRASASPGPLRTIGGLGNVCGEQRCAGAGLVGLGRGKGALGIRKAAPPLRGHLASGPSISCGEGARPCVSTGPIEACGASTSPGALIAGRAAVRGCLDKELIRKVVRSKVNQIRYCYQRQLTAGRPGLAGRVVVSFTIGPGGRVTRAEIASSEMGEPEVEACVTRAVRRWRFPLPKNGGLVEVSYPFVFRPAG